MVLAESPDPYHLAARPAMNASWQAKVQGSAWRAALQHLLLMDSKKALLFVLLLVFEYYIWPPNPKGTGINITSYICWDFE